MLDFDYSLEYTKEAKSILDDNRLPLDTKIVLVYMARDKYRVKQTVRNYERLESAYEEYKSKVKELSKN